MSQMVKMMKKGKVTPTAPQQAQAEKPEILPPDQLQKTMNEVENTKDEQNLHEKIVEAVGKKGWSDFRLGGLLLKAKSEGWFKSHKSIGDYCEAELGFRRSKAYHLMKMYDVVANSEVTWETVEHLGWSKVSLICGKVAPGKAGNAKYDDKQAAYADFSKYLDSAENQTYVQLQETLKAPNAVEATAPGVTVMTFKFHDDQKETIDEALAQAKKEGNTDVNSVALEYALGAYLAGPGKFGSQGENIHNLDDMIPMLKAWFARVKVAAEKDPIEGKTAQDTALTYIFAAFDQVFPDVNMTSNTD